MNNFHYNTIGKAATAEFGDRGSRFIAYAFPIGSVKEFKERLNDIKKEHPKATHHCFAYRVGIEGNTFRVSDDGEPSGTAGKPILGQIDSREITDTLVVVVRYFGGTQLGIPGLIHAYKTSAALVLQTVPVERKPVRENITIEFDYTKMNEVMRLLRQYDCVILRNEQQLFCHLEVAIPLERKADVLFKLNELPVTVL